MSLYYRGEAVSGPSGPSGPDGNPIGTIISFMGLAAPKDYLICDGVEYNISEYSELAQFFESQFGTSNYFGGDGETTFAVPDMRNLFLRGYHGNSTEKSSGNIGVKQDRTYVPNTFAMRDNGYFGISKTMEEEFTVFKNTEGELGLSRYVNQIAGSAAPSSGIAYRGVRPINMAVLYCIKAIPSEPILDEYDTEGGWHVRKWSDGHVEMSCTVYKSVVTSDLSRVGETPFYIITPAFTQIDYPVPLIERYCELVQSSPSAERPLAGWLIARGALTQTDITKTREYSFMRQNSINNDGPYNIGMDVHVTGRWK